MLWPEIVIESPVDRFRRLQYYPKKLVLEAIEGLGLLRAVDGPIVHSDGVIELVIGARAHMVKRQKVEPIGPRIVELVFAVVILEAQGTGEFAHIERQALAGGKHIGSLKLEHGTIHLRPRLVGSASLKRFRCLAQFEIQAPAETATGSGIGILLEDQACLIQTEGVAADVVGAQEINAADAIVEVVA